LGDITVGLLGIHAIVAEDGVDPEDVGSTEGEAEATAVKVG
jgi:hypothetical protein